MRAKLRRQYHRQPRRHHPARWPFCLENQQRPNGKARAIIAGKLLITSANPAYAPFEIDLAEMGENLAIIGRVEWFGRAIN